MVGIYLVFNGEPEGPYSSARIRELLSRNIINGLTPAWHKEMTEWSTVDAVLAKYPDENPVTFGASTLPDGVGRQARKRRLVVSLAKLRGWLRNFIEN